MKVVAKLAYFDHEDRDHLESEARAYCAMAIPPCDDLQKDWSGYVVSDGPYGCARYQMSNHVKPSISKLSAVVPKFYGYYTPTVGGKARIQGPILLMEDCGQSVYNFKSSVEYRQAGLGDACPH